MSGHLFLDLARRGLRMPIGTDLILHESPDPEGCRENGISLGKIVELAALRYGTPLAFPLMDLTLEKADLVCFLGVAPDQAQQFHFTAPPPPEVVTEMIRAAGRPFLPRSQARLDALRYIATRTELVPVGMVIGPFSLMTKLVSDPIIPVAMAGAGVTAGEDPSVCLVERCLALAEAAVLRSAKAQIDCGAGAMIVCEPAASTVFISPRQLKSGTDVLERFVLGPNRRLRELLGASGVDLVFHDCGELTAGMIRQFAEELRPAVLSLGSSRKLWEDAPLLPRDVVLFGNLPSKSFYSDAVMPVEEVRRLSLEIVRNMAASGYPHILGSECDVLHVPEAADTIRIKVTEMLRC